MNKIFKILSTTSLVFSLGMFSNISNSFASPPPVGSEDWKVMIPFKEWVVSQHDQYTRWCCDLGDGRPTIACIAYKEPTFVQRAKDRKEICKRADDDKVDKEDFWWVFIEKKHFPDEAERWLQVPPEKVVKGGNPMDVPIVWLYKGLVQCFAPPAGS